MRRIALTALLAALFISQGVEAQAPRAWSVLLEGWVAAIRDHQPGDEDLGVRRVADWSSRETEILFPYLDAMLQLFVQPDRQKLSRQLRRFSEDEMQVMRMLAKVARRGSEVNRVIKRAALLHTDVALFGVDDVEQITPSAVNPARDLQRRSTVGRQVVVRALDGQFTGMELGSFHWQLARRILDTVQPAPERDDTVRLWYRAVAATLASPYTFAELMPHLDAGQKLFPSDPHILFAAACLQEALASPRVQDEVMAMDLPRGVHLRGMFSKREHLTRAELLFQRALTQQPSLTEARVRLARVRSTQGEHQQAVSELRQVLPDIQDDVVRYYAEMFLGDVEEQRGSLEAALDAFGRAAKLFPRAQTPHIAMSRLARLRGDTAHSLATMQTALTLPLERRDPWWEYLWGPGRHADLLLDAARAALVTH